MRRGLSRGLSRGHSRGLSQGLSHGGIGPRSAKLWKSELRISRGVCCCRYSFCCLNSHHLLAAACGDPEIAFANSFRGPLKKCTNRRPFKLAMQHNFSIFHAVVRTLKKRSCFLTHPERVRRDKIKPVQLLCMGYNVTKSNFKTAQVCSIHGTYWNILVHTGTYWYRRRPNSTLHWITLCPPSCAYESQQNAWLGPFAQFPSAWQSPPKSDHPGVACHGPRPKLHSQVLTSSGSSPPRIS